MADDCLAIPRVTGRVVQEAGLVPAWDCVVAPLAVEPASAQPKKLLVSSLTDRERWGSGERLVAETDFDVVAARSCELAEGGGVVVASPCVGSQVAEWLPDDHRARARGTYS